MTLNTQIEIEGQLLLFAVIVLRFTKKKLTMITKIVLPEKQELARTQLAENVALKELLCTSTKLQTTTNDRKYFMGKNNWQIPHVYN